MAPPLTVADREPRAGERAEREERERRHKQHEDFRSWRHEERLPGTRRDGHGAGAAFRERRDVTKSVR